MPPTKDQFLDFHPSSTTAGVAPIGCLFIVSQYILVGVGFDFFVVLPSFFLLGFGFILKLPASLSMPPTKDHCLDFHSPSTTAGIALISCLFVVSR
ncbi:hypothetical protein HanRHA438_Chr16g0775181 [Helianthus annuus]|nr:hypothetical protein HanRHA438_Chr16g0775181 [Helianthus annuus]